MSYIDFLEEYNAFIWEHSLETKDCAGIYGLARHFYEIGLVHGSRGGD